tara:strand:- start:166 stop:690 length:525 start_codon:yes stop_codon:yes gene_type:complete
MEENEEIEESKFKKIFIIFIASFLVILMVSFVFVNSGGLRLIGWLDSSKEENNELDFSFDSKLVFVNNSLETLRGIYYENVGVEFKACLNGVKRNNLYEIDEVIVPITYEQRFNRVVAEPCTSENLVSLHSHPFRSCLPSQQDFLNFERFKGRNKDALMIIMCEDNRFSVYDSA